MKGDLQILELVFFNSWIGGVFDDFIFFVCRGTHQNTLCQNQFQSYQLAYRFVFLITMF
jgi:hypothetical protein